MVKPEYSEDELPLDSDFASVLLDWRAAASKSELDFPVTLRVGIFMPARSSRTTYVRQAAWWYVQGVLLQLGFVVSDESGKRMVLHDERRNSAGSLGHVGWHTFRHAYRSWLGATGAPLGVQQKLLRHAQISTTMNVYGNALMDSKRDANSRVAKLAL
jgi:integrase